MKKTFGFGSCVKPFAQQKWFLVASKTKRTKRSRKHINRSVAFLRLWRHISLFFFQGFLVWWFVFFSPIYAVSIQAKTKQSSVFENPDYHFPFYLGFP